MNHRRSLRTIPAASIYVDRWATSPQPMIVRCGSSARRSELRSRPQPLARMVAKLHNSTRCLAHSEKYAIGSLGTTGAEGYRSKHTRTDECSVGADVWQVVKQHQSTQGANLTKASTFRAVENGLCAELVIGQLLSRAEMQIYSQLPLVYV